MPSPESQAEKENATSLNTSKQVALLPTQADSADYAEIAELGTKFKKEKGEAGYPPPMTGPDYTLMVEKETWYGTDWVHHQNATKAMAHIEPTLIAAIKMQESAPACGAKSAIGILTLFIVETSLGRDTLVRAPSENGFEYAHGIWQDILPENKENASEDMRQLVEDICLRNPDVTGGLTHVLGNLFASNQHVKNQYVEIYPGYSAGPKVQAAVKALCRQPWNSSNLHTYLKNWARVCNMTIERPANRGTPEAAKRGSNYAKLFSKTTRLIAEDMKVSVLEDLGKIDPAAALRIKEDLKWGEKDTEMLHDTRYSSLVHLPKWSEEWVHEMEALNQMARADYGKMVEIVLGLRAKEDTGGTT